MTGRGSAVWTHGRSRPRVVNWPPSVSLRITMTDPPTERCVATAVPVAHRDSLRNEIVSPVERIPKPRSQKLFDFSIAQDAKKQSQDIAQYGRCNSYARHHKIRSKEVQSSRRPKANSQEEIKKWGEIERGRRKMSYGRPLKLLGWNSAPSPRWSAWSTRPRAPLPVSNPRPLRRRKKQCPPAGVD